MREPILVLRKKVDKSPFIDSDYSGLIGGPAAWITALECAEELPQHLFVALVVLEAPHEREDDKMPARSATTDVPPMAQVSDRYAVDQSKAGSASFAYASREDVHEGLRKSLPHEVALQNAPDSDGTFFKVPKVIER